MSTHNLSFRAKNKKKCIPLYTPVYYTKVGCKGVFVTRTCFRDAVEIKIYALKHTRSVRRLFGIRTHNVDIRGGIKMFVH